MSYRRAWLLVDEMNRCFDPPVVETLRGGGLERGARITDTGIARPCRRIARWSGGGDDRRPSGLCAAARQPPVGTAATRLHADTIALYTPEYSLDIRPDITSADAPAPKGCSSMSKRFAVCCARSPCLLVVAPVRSRNRRSTPIRLQADATAECGRRCPTSSSPRGAAPRTRRTCRPRCRWCGGDLLDQSYTVNTQGLTTLIPSLNYSSANPRNTAFTIRGLGSSVVAVSQANDGLEPGVGFYVDQVYHARPATAAFDFTDIEQVEELRGPQGTLFGKNTTAGAINITTRAPTFTPEGFAELSYGERNFVQAKGCGLRPDHATARLPPLGRRHAPRRRDRQRPHRPRPQHARQPGGARAVAVQARRRDPAAA